MEKLITSALISFFVVSATYVGFFMTLLIRCSCFVAVFALQFFSIGFLLEIYDHGHGTRGDIAGIAAAVTGFISTIMAVPISIFIGRFISRCHYLSVFQYAQL
jgi:DHA1 family bicyclomycin/chloramphenicol resistance-like MFS transporter